MEKDEFIQRVRDSEETLYHVGMSIVRNESDTADAVQEALLKAYEKLYTLRKPEFFKTWLVRILIHECYKIQNRKKRQVSYEDYIQSEEAEEKTDYTELYRAILKLPLDMRTAVTLFYIEGFSIEEIARMTGSGKNTVKTRLFRARARLRETLEREGEGIC